MVPEELVSSVQNFSDAVRKGRWEQVLATLSILLASAGIFLMGEGKELPRAANLAFATLSLCAVAVIFLAK